MTDQERADWVLKDKGLRLLQRASRKSLIQFVRANRRAIDRVVRNITSGARPLHYLVTGE